MHRSRKTYKGKENGKNEMDAIEKLSKKSVNILRRSKKINLQKLIIRKI